MSSAVRGTPTLLGLPYDASSSFLKGTAAAPPLIRQALHSPAGNPWTEMGVDLGADGADALLRTAITRLALSARAYHRILKIARTIADLSGGADLAPAHVSEAIQYRSLDRRGLG